MVTPCYEYELTVRGGEVTPCGVLDGGTAGDRGTLRLVFVTEDVAEYTYRAEAVNAAGGYDITEPLIPTDGRVTVDVPPHWMVAGTTAVRLIRLAIRDGEEVSRLYVSPVLIKFAYRDEGDGAAAAAPLWQEMLTRADAVLEQVQAAAVDASTAAAVAAEYAEAASNHAGSVDVRAEAARELAEQAMNRATAVQPIAEQAQETAQTAMNYTSTVETELRERIDAVGKQSLDAWTAAELADMKADDLLGRVGALEENGNSPSNAKDIAYDGAEEFISATTVEDALKATSNAVVGHSSDISLIHMQIGDIEEAVDGILAIQNELIGGNGV